MMKDLIIREAQPEDYSAVDEILRQVQKLHVSWRPDIYRESESV